MDAQLEASPVNTDKNQVIMDLVSALDAFDSATPVTGFPDKMAEKAKAARALAAELKDDLLLLKQNLEDASSEFAKIQPAPGATATAPVGDEDLSRFASATSRLDRVAGELEKLGLRKLATTLDTVSNTLERLAFRPGDNTTLHIHDVLNDFADNTHSGLNDAQVRDTLSLLKAAAGITVDSLDHMLMAKIEEIAKIAKDAVISGGEQGVQAITEKLDKVTAEVADLAKHSAAGQMK